MPIQNYQSINGDIENVNSRENIATIFSSIRTCLKSFRE